MADLLSLPTELIIKTLSFLHFQDLFRCQACCRRFRTIVEDSVLLQYIIQLETTGSDELSLRGESYGERLKEIRRREHGWSHLSIRSSMDVELGFGSSGIYDLTGGTFLLGTRPSVGSPRSTYGLSYLALPSLDPEGNPPREEDVKWKTIELGLHVVDVGLSIREHDLMAVLTCKPDVNGDIADLALELRLLSLSTGQAHPQASQPIVFLAQRSSHFGRCSVLIEIVGDYLVLLLSFPWMRAGTGDAFYLVNWKKGRCHLMHTTPQETPSSFTFLTPDLLLLTRADSYNVLEIVKILAATPDSVPLLRTLVRLELPPLAPLANIIRLICRSEPIPRATAAAQPETAIILFNILLQDAGPLHVGHMHMFSFITHRHTLLSYVPPSERAEPFLSNPPPFCSDEGGPRTLAWAEWGPRATRWFDCDQVSTRWITTTAGQRYVSINESQFLNEWSPIWVRDFNLYNVRRARLQAQRARDEEDRTGGGARKQRVRVVEGSSVITSSGLFENDLESSLPYCEVRTEGTYRFDGALIDEERILGLKLEEDGVGLKSFDVLMIG